MGTIAGVKRALELHSEPANTTSFSPRSISMDNNDDKHPLLSSTISRSERFSSPKSQVSSTSSTPSHDESFVRDSSLLTDDSRRSNNNLHLDIIDEEYSTAEGEEDSFVLSRQPSPSHSTASRASRRARKPTSKARALSGTRLLKSLEQGSEPTQTLVGPDVERSKKNLNAESQTHRQEERSESPIIEMRNINTVNIEDNSSLARKTDTAVTMEVDQLQGVDEAGSPRRASKRARRAPVRLRDELEQDETEPDTSKKVVSNRKSRTKPSSSAKPSKLRFSFNAGEFSDEEQGTISPFGSRQSPVSTQTSSAVSSQKNNKPSHSLTLKMSPERLAKLPCSKNLQPTDMTSKIQDNVEPSSVTDEDSTKPKCNLSCLTPSERLLAYGELAFEMPDIDLKDDFSEWFEEICFSAVFGHKVIKYCRCEGSNKASAS